MASLSSSLRGGPGVRLARGLPRPSALASRSVLTSQHVVTPSRSLFTRPKPRSPLRSIVTITLLGFAATFGVAYHLDSRSAIHRWIAIPVLQAVTDPETAQKLAVKLLSLGVMPRDMVQDDAVLETEVAGLALSNPIGLAAGFDKQAEAIDGLLNLGFGIVEVGSVTPEPQPGNEQPRYFRLIQDRGAINRFGFNSDGHMTVLARLHDRVQRWVLRQSTLAQSRVPLPDSSSDEARLLAHTEAGIAAVLERDEVPRSLKPGQLLFVNLGKNKTSAEASVEDYVKGVRTLGPYADAVVVNVSSPNTPGLRGLQRRDILQGLMSDVVGARDSLPKRGQEGRKLPILVKIAPDLDQSQLHDIADAALASGIDGLIVSNTTIQRPKTLLSSPDITNEKGGLSGAPLKPLALEALSTVRARVGDKIALIGCGGIHSGADALDFAKAGASAIELYTSFGYEGVGHPRRIKDELTALLREQGKTWKQVVGTGLDEDGKKAKVPSNEREASRSGGVSERMGEAVASVKSELEGLRRSLGMPELTSTTRTAAPFFQPDPNDTEYVSLLDKVHAVLGHPNEGAGEEAKTFEADSMTRAEALRARLGAALHDPNVPASQALKATGEQSTTTSSSPQSGRLEIANLTKLTEVSPRSSGSKLSTYAEGRVGMGGKAEFNQADRQRVV